LQVAREAAAYAHVRRARCGRRAERLPRPLGDDAAYRVARALHLAEAGIAHRLPQGNETTAANTAAAAPPPDLIRPHGHSPRLADVLRDGVAQLRQPRRRTVMRGASVERALGRLFDVLARARALERQGKQVVHLEIGEPDFDTPEHLERRLRP